MNLTAEIAKQFRDLHFGGNWTAANLKDSVTEVSWQQAISKVKGFNSIASKEDWKQLPDQVWKEAEGFDSLVEQLPEALLWGDFADGKYRNYYSNIHCIIEHLHYHLGQFVLIKTMLP